MSLSILSEAQTAVLLPFAELSECIATAAREYAARLISSPERQVLPLRDDALLLSMPATAGDVGIHKLVTFAPNNGSKALPLIHGLVAVYSSVTGEPLLLLDGATVTARRTACVSMLAIRSMAPGVKYLALIGIGKQASGHLEALADLFPGIRVDVHGREPAKTQAFCEQHRHLPLQISPRVGRVEHDVQVVIAATSSKRPVYEDKVRPGRLLIGVGAFNAQMAEYSPDCVNNSQVFVDDLLGGRHEAGDLIQANVDWQSVSSLADAIDGRFDPTRPLLFKSVGCAAWDLAAGRCAVSSLEAERG